MLEELPAGYLVTADGGGYLAVHVDFADRLHAAGYGLASRGDFRPSSLAGREPLRELGGDGPRLLLRRFTHGGLLRRWTGRRFRDPARPFRELILSDALRSLGIPTPRVAAAAARPLGFGWELEIVTTGVEDTLDLGALLGLARRGELARGVLRRALVALGDLVARLHRVGCEHADLQPNNVLVGRAALAGAQPRLWILDLDRSRLAPPLSDGERHRNLERLYRSVARREALHGPLLTRGDYRSFFAGYARTGDGWRSDWRAVEELHSRDHRWHRLGWGLERALGTRRDESRDSPAPPGQVSAREAGAGAGPCAGTPAPPT